MKSKNRKDKKLPIFGVGAFYVLTCLFLKVLGFVLKYFVFLKRRDIPYGKEVIACSGFILIISGIILWFQAVVFQHLGREVKKRHLVTEGVYSFVRNPIYSAFLFIFPELFYF